MSYLDIVQRIAAVDLDAERAMQDRVEHIVGAALHCVGVGQMIGDARSRQKERAGFAELIRIEVAFGPLTDP